MLTGFSSLEARPHGSSGRRFALMGSRPPQACRSCSPRTCLALSATLALTLILPACSLAPTASPPAARAPDTPGYGRRPESIPTSQILKRPGGFYTDDGPDGAAPANLAELPDALPKAEPLHASANDPYSVFGRDYVPLKTTAGYKRQGTASWYGRKFHGQRTVSGEIYDMYGMTAAHPTLPIPSYVRVTRPANGKSVVVRVNDRGPFHAGRLIDLSWTAAYKLGYLAEGSSLVEVELIVPGRPLKPLSGESAARPATMESVADVKVGFDADESDPIMRLALAEEARALPAAQPLVETHDAAGHYIQLGAFGNRDNAETLRAHLGRELGALGEKLLIRSAGKVFRVQLGPWPDEASASKAGEQLRETFSLAPLVVQH